ncbi:hypothetical protein [Jeotgalibacillus soli]|uniref:Uncharacterized protein n=1 Tax=Jeotgalibacillus soli TaxID=889306 RepID=A0A0C2V9U6_9BACL|nr:hypothetical protein [Jeotgalibacillus soli]KIL45732.1 hypothetical protein KP78_20810 [Jeotgalibacillus soli]
MSYGSVGKAVRTLRGKDSQLKFSLNRNVSRESISAYERGVTKLPKDISKGLMEEYDDPFFAMVVRQNYTGTGPVYLDGEAVDLHRSSVKEKTIEEMEEALAKLRSFCMAKPLHLLTEWEKDELRFVLEEVAEAEVAMNHLMAVVCKESNISYSSIWKRIYDKFASLKYITKATFAQVKKATT